MPTPVDMCRHGLSGSSVRPPPSALVAGGQGWRQDTRGAGPRAGSSVGTEIAPASVSAIGQVRCRVMAPDRFTGPPRQRTNRWRRSCLPDCGGSRRIRLMPGACSRGSGRCDPGGKSAGTLANGLRAPRAASVCQHGGVWRGPLAGLAATADGRTMMNI
jgi:hypothetical protein